MTFDPRDMLLSLQMGFSFVRAAVACVILERTSGLEPSSETTAPRYLKLVTVPSLCPFTFIFRLAWKGSTGCRTFTNLQFADKLDIFAEEEHELEILEESPDETNTKYGKEMRAKMTKPMINSVKESLREIKAKWLILRMMTNFKYLGVVVPYDGLKL